jgi:hypothetical protein
MRNSDIATNYLQLDLVVPTQFKTKSQEATANCISRFFFYWTGDLIYRGYKKPLSESDLLEIRVEEKILPTFKRYEEIQENHPNITFAEAVHRTTRTTFYSIFFLVVIANLVQFIGR